MTHYGAYIWPISVVSQHIVKMADVETLVELYGGDLLFYLNLTYPAQHCMLVPQEARMFISSEGRALAAVQPYTVHICVQGDSPVGKMGQDVPELGHIATLANDSAHGVCSSYILTLL